MSTYSQSQLWGLTSRTQPLNPAFGEGTVFCIEYLVHRIDTFLSDTTTQGSYTTRALTQGMNGNYYYGVTRDGGQNGCCILFSYDPLTNKYKIELEFDNTMCHPVGKLTLGTNGKLYELSKKEGNYGGVYEYDHATHNAVITNFNSLNGCYPNGGHLLQATEGNFYGITLGWAVINNPNCMFCFYDIRVIIFKYDPITKLIDKKFYFTQVEDSLATNPIGSFYKQVMANLWFD